MIPGLPQIWTIILLNVLALTAGGVAAASFLDPGEEDEDIATVGRVLAATAWGAGVIPLIAFSACLLTGARLQVWMLWAVSGVHVAAALVRGLPSWPDVRRSLRRVAGPLALAAAIAASWGVTFDGRAHASESCIYRTAYAAIGRQAPGTDLEPDVDLLRNNVEDARLGNTAVLASFLALSAGVGFRLLFALAGGMLTLGGWLLGRRIGGAAWGWAGALLLPLNPYVLSFPQLDENLLTLAFACGLLPWLGGRKQWAAAGVLFGVAVTMRHVLLPAILAPLWLSGRRSGVRGAVLFAAGFVAATAVEGLHHKLAMGSWLAFESNPQFPPMPYSLLGFDFGYAGFMNWPLHDRLVRTPHNPFPMLVTWPLQLIDHLGALGAAAGVLGAGALLGRWRDDGVFWLLWTPIVFAGLALQEAWDTTNKMWVMTILFGAVAAWVLAGLHWVGRRPGRWAVLLGLAVALWAGPRALRDWRAPVDDRYCQYDAAVAAERDDLLAIDLDRLAAPGLLPGYHRVGVNGPLLSAWSFRSLFHDLADPRIPAEGGPWGWYEREPPDLGPVEVWAIDLSAPPLSGTGFVRRAPDGPVDLDLTRPGVHRGRGLAVPWDGRRLQVWGQQSPRLASVVVFFDDPALDATCHTAKESRPDRLEAQRCWAVTTLLGVEEECDGGQRTELRSPVVRVRARRGGLSFALERSVGPDRLVLWTGRPTEDGIELAAPVEPWDN